MILLKTLAPLLAVLIAVAPAAAKVGAPEDPAALPAVEEPAEEGQSAPHWLLCARRCKENCLGEPNVRRCATDFISRKCKPFGRGVGDVPLTKCLEGIECENDGMKVCDNSLECLLPQQCCLDGGCNEEKYRCSTHWCAAKGSPSFTLTWTGYDDLDLHVFTPAGVELYYGKRYDRTSKGRFQHDDVPDTRNTTWQETVYFPLDRSAPKGTYNFSVHNGHTVPDPARPYAITIYEGDEIIATKRGRVANRATTRTYRYNFVP